MYYLITDSNIDLDRLGNVRLCYVITGNVIIIYVYNIINENFSTSFKAGQIYFYITNDIFIIGLSVW